MQVKTALLDEASPRLVAVRRLWRANSRTLGFFPEGAFIEYARKDNLLGAQTSDGELIGYLLFRLSGSTAVIVHLCVDANHRGKGVARCLFDALKAHTPSCRGVRLTCRTDFVANALWERLDFEPRAEKPAREPGRFLKVWWYDYGHADLFSQARDHLPLAVLDANVFFDLQDPETTESLESKALTADWLQDSVKLALSPEIYREIDRRRQQDERLRRRQFADTFSIVRPGADHVGSLVEQLSAVAPHNLTPSDASDTKHLAHAIAAGASYFVTRDSDLLRKASTIAKEWHVTVVRPSQLISLTDEELHGSSYQPARLAGTTLHIGRISANDLDSQTEEFLACDLGERKVRLHEVLRGALSRPDRDRILHISGSDPRAVGLVVYRTREDHRLEVPVFRIKRGVLATTLARHLAWTVVRNGAAAGVRNIVVTDPHLDDSAQLALSLAGFEPLPTEWSKTNIYGIHTRVELRGVLDAMATRAPHVEEALLALRAHSDLRPWDQLELERLFWPAKIVDGSLPTFIVPVKPHWAMNLFHEGAAAEDLFGADPRLILNVENAYYRAPMPRYPTCPSRVLWYVSGESGHSSSSQLVATSLVTFADVGPATRLFARFKRLGVFAWNDVRALAKNDPHGLLLVFVFSHTELFPRPLPWPELQASLARHLGRRAPVQAPIQVPQEAFADIYARATAGRDP